MTDDVTRLQLPNGLQVLLKEIHTAPIISQWVWYRVGSRDEVPGITGISHWVEHMQFKGTPNFTAGDLDRAISRDGGHWNAMTYIDWTTYFETMPSAKINLVLQLEADRMANSLFSLQEVEAERSVIISERQGNENDPLFLLNEEMQAVSFRVHSYHHETIGDIADLETIQRDELYDHYRKFYVPSNAVLALTGDFETKWLVDLIQEAYGPVPAGPTPVRRTRPEPPQLGERRTIIEGPGETTYVQFGFHVPRASDPDFYPLTVLDSLLSGPSSLNMFGGGISNKTSRLYRTLVEGELAVGVYGGVQATIDPYLYTILLTIHPQRTAEEAIRAVEVEIQRIQDSPPSQDELARAVKQARALFAYGSESLSNQAFWLGYSEMFASYDWFLSYLDQLAAVSPADIQRVAQRYLRAQNRIIGIYLPTGEMDDNE